MLLFASLKKLSVFILCIVFLITAYIAGYNSSLSKNKKLSSVQTTLITLSPTITPTIDLFSAAGFKAYQSHAVTVQYPSNWIIIPYENVMMSDEEALGSSGSTIIFNPRTMVYPMGNGGQSQVQTPTEFVIMEHISSTLSPQEYITKNIKPVPNTKSEQITYSINGTSAVGFKDTREGSSNGWNFILRSVSAPDQLIEIKTSLIDLEADDSVNRILRGIIIN
jgi:hypothetical protein